MTALQAEVYNSEFIFISLVILIVLTLHVTRHWNDHHK